jgi:hypothetical protein
MNEKKKFPEYLERPASELAGLGREPTDQMIGEVLHSSNVLEYSKLRFNLPLNEETVDQYFGTEIDLLGFNIDTEEVKAEGSFMLNGILQADMIATGYELTIDGDSICFSCEDQSANILEWGKPTWDAARYLLRGYSMQMRVYHRILLVNEPLIEVARLGSVREPVQKIDGWTKPYIDSINSRYSDKCRKCGSVGGKARSFGKSVRSLVEMTSDSHYLENGEAGVRKFPRPVLLEKGIPVDARLIVDDQSMQDKMRNALLDNAFTFKGGSLTIGFNLCGVEVWGPWKNFLQQRTTNEQLCIPGMSGRR